MVKKQSVKVWLPNLINALILRLVLAVTFIMIPVALGFTIYYSLINFNLYKSLVGCAMLFAMPYVNTRVQGAK